MKRVCQNHFDRYQFDNLGNRLSNGYPCLFSANEMCYGIPLSSTGGDHLSDHNYCLTTVPECMENISTTAMEVREDHSYYKIAECEIPEPMEISDEAIEQVPSVVPVISGTTNTLVPKRAMKLIKKCVQKNGKQKKNLSKCIGFARQIKTQVQAVREISFNERLAQSESLSQKCSFLKNFDQMNKQAQDFILMQLRAVNKKKKVMRFTDNEKLLALTLMKESPKGYRLLQKIYKLPAKRTLNRLAEKVFFSVGINDNLFRLIENKSMYWDIKKKICPIVFDEIALTPHLTYVESKDQIEGFKDLGNQKYMKFSDHALVFMLRGICFNWRQPIAYYFCEGTTSTAEVKRILKELVAKVSQSGLIPLALVCDQGATFRSAIKMLRQETAQKKI